MLVLEWIRGDLVALLVIVVIGVTHLMPVEQLFESMSTTMPADNVGGLLTSEYVDVLAYNSKVYYVITEGGGQGFCVNLSVDTGSLDIMELNPALDSHNRTAELAVDLVESLFGKSTLMRD